MMILRYNYREIYGANIFQKILCEKREGAKDEKAAMCSFGFVIDGICHGAAGFCHKRDGTCYG